MKKIFFGFCIFLLSCSSTPTLNRQQKSSLAEFFQSLYIGQTYPGGHIYLQKWMKREGAWPKTLQVFPLESQDWQKSASFVKEWGEVHPTSREKTKYLSSPKEDFFGDGYQKFKPDFLQVGFYQSDDKNTPSMNVIASSMSITAWGKANYDLPKNLTEDELRMAVKLPENSPEQYIKNLKYISSFQIEGLAFQFVLSEGQHAENGQLVRTWLIEVFSKGKRVRGETFRQYKGPI